MTRRRKLKSIMTQSSLHNYVQQAGNVEIHAQDWVELTSAGRLLIIGAGQQLQIAVRQLSAMDYQLVCLDDEPDPELDRSRLIKDKLLWVKGWMGQFKAGFETMQISVDLVLDLLEQPIVKTKVLPFGYFAPHNNQLLFEQSLQQLPELVGIFDKPRYFNYNAAICAHSRSQLSGCSACLQACPADAISSSGDSVTINPSLCQGCGSCVSVCPTGAVEYALPNLETSLQRLRNMTQAWFKQESSAPHVLIYDLDQGRLSLESKLDQLPSHILCFDIEEIGALGMVFWVSALAYGAGAVTIWDAGTHSDHDWQELRREVSKTNQMLQALGYQDGMVNWFSKPDVALLSKQLTTTESWSGAPAAQFAAQADKRRVLHFALSHLHAHAPSPVALIALPDDAGFGEIQVDTEACTLCHACVTVCPVGALQDGIDQPQLNFIEDHCVQCGLCDAACPEQAITLNGRYLFDRIKARHPRLLHDEPVFRCIVCDQPFATHKMINTMIQKLKSHAMFQGEAIERLKMCQDCRVKAMLKESQS